MKTGKCGNKTLFRTKSADRGDLIPADYSMTLTKPIKAEMLLEEWHDLFAVELGNEVAGQHGVTGE